MTINTVWPLTVFSQDELRQGMVGISALVLYVSVLGIGVVSAKYVTPLVDAWLRERPRANKNALGGVLAPLILSSPSLLIAALSGAS
eukprot:g1155.t1